MSITLRIELDREAAGTVVLHNDGAAPVRVWRPGNRWADEALSFELSRAGGVQPIVRNPQIYTRNVPGSVEIPAGGEFSVPFDLHDGTWPRAIPPGTPGVDGLLAARYAIHDSPEAAAQGVWIGSVCSEWVPLGGREGGST